MVTRHTTKKKRQGPKTLSLILYRRPGSNRHVLADTGFRVRQYFPDGDKSPMLDRMSPFLLLDYNEPYYFEASPFDTGVTPHPHKGFETVTFSFSGSIEHKDAAGNSGVIHSGDVQWMTAASGVLHK